MKRNKDITRYKTQNGKIRYRFKIYAGKDEETGNSIQARKQGFKSYDDALKVYFEIKDKIAKGTYTGNENKKHKFSELYEMWLENYKNTVKVSTLSNTKLFFRLHILPELGNLYIEKITTFKCQKIVNKWFKELPKTYKVYTNLASNIFKFAVNNDLIVKNPMKSVIKPKLQVEKKPFTNFYSKNELNIFLKEAKECKGLKVYMLFRLLAYTGMRRGEALALKWSDIDLSNQTIKINKTVTTAEHAALIIGTPKTKASYRTIAIDKQTIKCLSDWRKEQRKELFQLGFNALSDNQLIFSNGNNELIRQATVRKWDQSISKHAGLKYITVHGFRHTHASLLFEAGTPMQDVKERLGHSSITTTMNIYTHVTKSAKKKTADNFAQFMEG
ncbi:site-specific integrase [Lactobacillus gasseri]|nr:site-specific integrase [Lactobacillus gasseri]MCZ3762268.1 site-specific integrase [Lactobacillus gasseri]MCZ3765749.1 site-specific integrase [Lactobacillus gasseri]MCZ3767464.1 site-specific integrase [Lactobacillus gasseri]MCZ3771019.1 site-specific integrase [Lactobacillus gasseri]